MRIFISYASENRDLAELLAFELRESGHTIFLDRDELQPSAAYTERIRSEIQASRLFIFLITPSSVTAGRYTRTELRIAESVWPNPNGFVLPVMAVPTLMADVPTYLRSVTILMPDGDLVADAVHAVAAIANRRGNRRRVHWIAGGVSMVSIAAAAFLVWPQGETPKQAKPSAAEFEISGSSSLTPGGTARFNLTNKRPAALSDFRCEVDYSALNPNVAWVRADPKCERISMKAAPAPWRNLAEPYDIYRRYPININVYNRAGEIVWKESWGVQLIR